MFMVILLALNQLGRWAAQVAAPQVFIGSTIRRRHPLIILCKSHANI
jgi:hypothetical protein